ncbi:MAG: response regulator transcription factor [Pseudomonadota bacterium]|nr:response regulator transcription factor [Pseudomonadota bacterium]
MRILLVEDNRDLAATVADHLEVHGHAIDAAADGITGLHLAAVNDYHVIVLDLMLPGLDGVSVCRRLREAGRDTPVLMLTARDTLADKLAGFASGADDYLVKPFSLQELLARLTALGRRGSGGGGCRRLRVADLEFDQGTLEVRRGGRGLELTPVGLKLLALLMRESPRVVTRRRIEEALWGDQPPQSDALRAHVHALRSAIDKPFAVPLLHTVHGIGYRLAAPDAPSP